MAEWHRLSGLSRGIKSGKEHRQEYRGAKAIDCSCRNHGTCDWCRKNRLHSDLKAREAAEQAYREYFDAGMQTLKASVEEPDVEDIVIEDVFLDGEPFDGHMFDRAIESIK